MSWASEISRKKAWLRCSLARCLEEPPIDPSLCCIFRAEGSPDRGETEGLFDEIRARMAGMDPADRAELEAQVDKASHPYCWKIRFLGVLDGLAGKRFRTEAFRQKHPFLIAAEFGSPEELAAVAEWCLGDSPSDYLLVDAAQAIDLSAPVAAKAKLAFILSKLPRVTLWSLRCLGRFKDNPGLAVVLGNSLARKLDAEAAGSLLLKAKADRIVPSAEWAFSFLEAIVRRGGRP
jgi:hypothetical protein